MHLDQIYFDYISEGKKIYETRVYDDKRRKIKLLDIVNFYDRGSERNFKAMIVELSYFDNFEEAITEVGIEKVLPNAETLEEGVKLYEGFSHSEGNFKKGAKKFGVLRMKFQLI